MIALRAERPRVAERLRKMRAFKRLSQGDVAHRIGLSRAALSAIETGKRRVDSLELLALARVYQYPTAFFLGEPAEYGVDPRLHDAFADLDDEGRAELIRFADYLKVRRSGTASA